MQTTVNQQLKHMIGQKMQVIVLCKGSFGAICRPQTKFIVHKTLVACG